jgi:hypothetical protein
MDYLTKRIEDSQDVEFLHQIGSKRTPTLIFSIVSDSPWVRALPAGSLSIARQ